MLSRGDLRHLPPTEKRYRLAESIYCLWAGGNSLCTGIINAAGVAIERRLREPGGYVTVHVAAECIRESYEWARIVEGAAEVLPRHLIPGLSEYRAQYDTLTPKAIRDIGQQMSRFRFEPEEEPAFIVFGLDADGSHLFKVFRDFPYRGKPTTRVDAHDGLGFATIGSNTEPADQPLFDRQAWHQPFGVALMLAYAGAQYAANKDEGVGPPEDIVFLGPAPEGIVRVNDLGMFWLKILYEGTVTQGRGGLDAALQMAQQFKRQPDLGIPMPLAASFAQPAPEPPPTSTPAP